MRISNKVSTAGMILMLPFLAALIPLAIVLGRLRKTRFLAGYVDLYTYQHIEDERRKE